MNVTDKLKLINIMRVRLMKNQITNKQDDTKIISVSNLQTSTKDVVMSKDKTDDNHTFQQSKQLNKRVDLTSTNKSS